LNELSPEFTTKNNSQGLVGQGGPLKEEIIILIVVWKEGWGLNSRGGIQRKGFKEGQINFLTLRRNWVL